MTDPRDDLDAWLNAQVQPLPPPPGTFELIRKRARRRKATRAAGAAAAGGRRGRSRSSPRVPRLVITAAERRPGASPRAAPQPASTSSAQPRPQHTRRPRRRRPRRRPTPGAGAPPPLPPQLRGHLGDVRRQLTPAAVIGQAGVPGHCGPPSRASARRWRAPTTSGTTWHGVSAPVTGAPDGPAGVSQVRFLQHAATAGRSARSCGPPTTAARPGRGSAPTGCG